jgi:uncharacterized protein
MKSFLAISLLWSLISFSQNNSLLYKVTKANDTHYLFGTIHVITKDLLNIDTTLKLVIKESDSLILEVSDITSPEIQAEIMDLIKIPEGKEFKDYFSPEFYDSLISYFKTNIPNMPIEYLTNNHPYLSMQILLTLELNGVMPESVEQEISKIAKDYKTPIGGLESLNYQFELLDLIGYEDLLSPMLIKDSTNSLDSLMNYYANSDTNALHILIDEMSNESKDIMLDQRNISWVKRIVNTHDKTNIYAVGCAHLLGKNGLINLLKTRGYTITEIKTIDDKSK